MERVLARAGGHARPVPSTEPPRPGPPVTERQAAANLATILGADLLKRTDTTTGKEIR